MPTIEIPRAEWGAFFHSFTRMYGGWLCTLEVISPTLGAHTLARNLPLAGISADRGPNDPPIRIALGTLKDSLSHSIDAPAQIRVRRTAEGADEALEIVAGGVQTRLSFRVPAMPETVDGIA